MLKLPIRWRLTLWYASAMGAILVVFCGLLILLSYQQLLARMDGELREELQELSLEAELAENPQQMELNLQARFRNHETFDFLVYDATDKLLFASSHITPEVAAELSASSPPLAQESFETVWAKSDAYFRVASRPAATPNGRLIVQVLAPLEPIIDDVQTLGAAVAFLLPACLLLALLGGYLLAVRALAPVDEIVSVAESISISQLDRRIEVANSHDELGRLALTLNRLIDRLQNAIEEIRRFTADASHELRTPLAILRSEAESALRKLRSPEEYREALSVIVDEATRLGKLTDQLLTLSRHDAGLGKLRMEPVSIAPLVLDVTDSLRSVAADQGVTLTAHCGSDGVVEGNDIRLSQAIFNVLENAVKYSPDGGDVNVSVTAREDQIQITIRDEGIGIPADQLSRVFERFYRGAASRNRATGGSGLGLAIAQSIVAAHRGTIAIESEPSVGTVVTISLPGYELTSDNLTQADRTPCETPAP